mmetsp:Transcript_27262/g.90592  ORF Transcript_27262/g.90592 Transcript_27262/m.90592 type:complete len:214 (-) Transcript_27262:300-941(-)
MSDRGSREPRGLRCEHRLPALSIRLRPGAYSHTHSTLRSAGSPPFYSRVISRRAWGTAAAGAALAPARPPACAGPRRHTAQMSPIRAATAASLFPAAALRAFLHCSSGKPISTISAMVSASHLLSTAYVSVQNFAFCWNACCWSLYCFATSASCGSSGSGADSSACSEMRAVRMVSAGDHSFLSMSRQMAPLCEETLGCHTLVRNFIFGGTKG